MQELKNKISTKVGFTDTSENKLEPPIFILGSGRSGTSLIRSILQRSPDIYCIEGETHLFSHDSNPYLKHLETFQAINDLEHVALSVISSILYGQEVTTLFARDKRFPKDTAEIYNEIKDLIISNECKNIYEIFDICISYITKNRHKKRWVEKTPNNIFHIPGILSIYPNARFIEIYRDPRGVFHSWKNAKQDYFKKTNILECIKKWKGTFELSKKYANELTNQFYKLKYEDLLENSNKELSSLFEFLNEEYNLLLTEPNINKERAYSWKDHLTQNELLLIDLKTKKQRKELGYTDSHSKLNFLNITSFYLFYTKKFLERQEGLSLISKIFDKITFPINQAIVLMTKLFGRIIVVINKLFGRIIVVINKLFGRIIVVINKLFGRIIVVINKLFGRIIVVINKSIGITNELLQSILRKPYSLKRKCKTLFWVVKRQKQIQKYLNTSPTKNLHIGAGPCMLSGWLNTNIIPLTKEDIFLDASRRFPFEDNVFDYVFSEHQIEHLNYRQGMVMLKECFRVLKPGGRIRIVTPNLESFIALYKKELNEIEKEYINYTMQRCFKDLKHNKDVFTVNNVFTNFGHKFIYDQNTLKYGLEANRFAEIRFYAPGATEEKAFLGIEQHYKMFKSFGFEDGEKLSKFDSFAVEARKPIIQNTDN